VLKTTLTNLTDSELTLYGMQRTARTEVIVKPNPVR